MTRTVNCSSSMFRLSALSAILALLVLPAIPVVAFAPITTLQRQAVGSRLFQQQQHEQQRYAQQQLSSAPLAVVARRKAQWLSATFASRRRGAGGHENYDLPENTSSENLPHQAPSSSSSQHSQPEDAVTSNTNNGGDFPTASMPLRAPERGISSLELRHMSEARRRRLEEEEMDAKAAAQFVTGDELHELRQSILKMSQQLHQARQRKDKKRVQRLEKTILEAQSADAEYVYMVATERMQAAKAAGRTMLAEQYRHQAAIARKALPQFQLEGLWVGKYGSASSSTSGSNSNDNNDHGAFEMINITYSGDVLTAHKVTGDQNVPKGQVTFTVDLSPSKRSMEPIELGAPAARTWGSRWLQRFTGQGQVADAGFTNSQWMEGQLILINQYFSFAWLPIGYQVFFGRPSAELTLKLLRQAREAEASKLNSRKAALDHLNRCMEETILLEQEDEMESEISYSPQQHDYYNQAGCFE